MKSWTKKQLKLKKEYIVKDFHSSADIEWMNEWMDGWMDEWIYEWRNEEMKEWINEGIKSV